MPSHKRLEASLLLFLCLFASIESDAQGVVHSRDELGAVKRVGFLPLYGGTVPIAAQIELARVWAGRWSEVRPGAEWISPYATGQLLADESLFARWSAGEAQLGKVGAMPKQLVQEICRALTVDAILQGVLGGDLPAVGVTMQSGSAGSFGLAVRGVTGGRVTLAYNLVSCRTGTTIWSASRHLDYMRDFTAAELATYAQKDLLGDIPR